ncbi:MAG: Rieske 2Fe-2S domain-containing protein, partial [Myxococcales bacterium]|nr:Rieske 2Fe-2S domain-containing protein [Myxococcales bacterium]
MRYVTNQHHELPVPNGWFAVAWSSDLARGDVKPVRYFGEDLVVFRTRSGEVRVLNALCAHLGAHLAHGGRVMGETIRCPFHGWRYDGEGRCAQIPYCDRIPPKARVRSWPVTEANGMIFAWHHAQDKPPHWEVPEIPELRDANWTEPRRFELEVGVHVQELAENNCDPVHFFYVHGDLEIPETTARVAEDGRFMSVVGTNAVETPLGRFNVTVAREAWSLGGVVAVRLEGMGDAGLVMFNSASPIDPRRTRMRWLLTTTEGFADTVGEEF